MSILYLDMNIYKRPFDDQRQMRIQLETLAITAILALLESDALSARWSFVLDYENSRDPVADRREFAQYVARCCQKTVEPDESIREFARQLADMHGVHARDALHLACAEQSGCDYLLTCDDRLVAQGHRLRDQGILHLKVLNPLDFVKEV